MVTTTTSRPDLADPAFARRWREFARRCGASFFQDWTWVGRLATERFPDPVLVEARRAGEVVAMALFNRRADRPWGETLHLHESGVAAWDAVFTEHNGPLVLGEERERTLYEVLCAAMDGRARRVALSGVGPETRRAVESMRGGPLGEIVRSAPYVDLDELAAATAFIDTLSRNTRQQLRRSNRDYARLGVLSVRRAETAQDGLRDFEALVRLHEATWKARGLPGAFSGPQVRRFHEALITEGVPRGEVDLLRIEAGGAVIGYLINFNHFGVVSAYQSGFDYASAEPHMKPGLTAHYLAIEAAREAGAKVYDFLAGSSRYKSSFANAERSIYWLSVASGLHPFAWRESARRAFRKLAGGKSSIR